MKKIILFAILAVLGIIVASWFLRHGAQPQSFTPTNVLTAHSQPLAMVPTISKPTNENGQVDTNVPMVQNTNDAHLLSLSVHDFYAQTRIDPKLEWKMPINFWGKVIDESNNPVADANMHFGWTDLSEKGTSDVDVRSDENGLFSLIERRGKRLSVSIRKEGYYGTVTARQSFEYAQPDMRFVPDQNNPILFRLRKKGLGADLICDLRLFGFKTNGTPYYLDLIEGKIKATPPGDLAVQFTRGEQESSGKYDWSVTITVPNGGLLETNEEFMFFAPEGDYERSITIHHSADDVDWVSQVDKKFYIRSRNGSIYGRAEAKIIPKYQNSAAIDLDYCVNPSGSRNLEPK